MQLRSSDPERVALAYLLALNEDCCKHISDLYDTAAKGGAKMDDDSWLELLYEDILQVEVPEIDQKVIQMLRNKKRTVNLLKKAQNDTENE
jgi:hypothetical protein